MSRCQADCADNNEDGVVNWIDFLIVRNNIGRAASECSPPGADVNGDGAVNAADLLVIRNYMRAPDRP